MLAAGTATTTKAVTSAIAILRESERGIPPRYPRCPKSMSRWRPEMVWGLTQHPASGAVRRLVWRLS